MQKEQSKTDEALQPFLQASDEQAQELLAELIAKDVEPLIRQIVRRKLSPAAGKGDARAREDAEDVCREAIVGVIRRLRAARNDFLLPGIDNLRNYVAVTAYNACSEYVRRKYPERHRLNNRLRYTLTHQENFDLWESEDNQWLCGLRAWGRVVKMRAAGGPGLQDCAHVLRRIAGRDSHSVDLASLLDEIFKCAG